MHLKHVITVSGGNAEGGSGSVSYSIGQLFYRIQTGENGSVAHGHEIRTRIERMEMLMELPGIKRLHA